MKASDRLASSAAGRADPLLGALSAPDWPEGEIDAWLAGESGVIRRLREDLLVGRGPPPGRIRAAGYWRRDAAGRHDVIED